MNRKSILSIIFILLISFGIISLYTTFAYDEEAKTLDESKANYNLIYSLREGSDRQISIPANDTKYVDITLINPYEATVRYGAYYSLINPQNVPEGLTVTLSPDSVDLAENTISTNQTRNITIMITNNNNYNVDLMVGALIGFENGRIEDLVKNGEILIK